MKIEAQGKEAILRNSNGDIAIIPIQHVREVMDMIKDGCHGCIDKYVSGLPKASNYAEDGTVIDDPPWYKSDWYNSAAATVVKIIDPTGISSYGDVVNAWSDGKFTFDDIVEPIGALPLVGKLGKIMKGGKTGIKMLDELSDAKKVLNETKIEYTDYIMVGGRKLKRSFDTKLVSPYSIKEIKNATKTVKKYKSLDNSLIGTRIIGDVPQIIDLNDEAKQFGLYKDINK